jgi:hypothetical protein
MIKVGDIVRVKEPDRFKVAFSTRIKDRDGVVESVFTPLGWGAQVRARVRFLKRNGRGKEFIETININDLVPVIRTQEGS